MINDDSRLDCSDMEEDDDEFDSECGATEDSIKGWQCCSLAGTEYCDFECNFARMIRNALREPEPYKKPPKAGANEG